MKIIIQLAVILLFYALGEIFIKLTGINFPGSIVGMLLLVLALEFKIIQVSTIKEVSTFFLNNMIVFFIPLGVGLMNQWGIISKEWLPIVVASATSTFIVIGVVAFFIKRNHE